MLQPQHKHFVPSPLPSPLLFFSFCFFPSLLTSPCGEQREGNKSHLLWLFVVLSSPGALRLLFVSISASLEVSVSFGNRSCSVSDSANSLARVEIMWKKQIVKQINKDTLLEHVATAMLHSACCQATFGSLPWAVGVRASVLNLQKAKSKPTVPCGCVCTCRYAKMTPRNSNIYVST